jgi:oligosaccharide repeat unit polymerase
MAQLTEQVVLHVILMWIVCMSAMFIMKFDITHPLVWFSAGFTLYATGYAMICCMGLGFYGYSKENIVYPMIALMISIGVIGDNKISIDNISIEDNIPISFIGKMSSFCAIILLICVMELIASGYSGKSEMKQANDQFYRVGVYCARYLSFFVLLKICSYMNDEQQKRKILPNIVIMGIPILLFTLYTGERDAFIRYCAIMIFALYYLKIIKKRHFFVLIPIFMAVMICSVYLKYFFTTGIINNSLQGNNLLYQFLRTDFIAQGRNFQYLLNNEWTNSSQSFKILITELLYPFAPSGVFFSPDRWFNYEVHTGGFKGYAFTMVGTGYIISGLFGVIIVFIIVSLVTKVLYRKSCNGLYGLCTYIYSIPTIIFSFRESLNTIFVALVRIVFISIFMCYLVRKRHYKVQAKSSVQ